MKPKKRVSTGLSHRHHESWPFKPALLSVGGALAFAGSGIADTKTWNGGGTSPDPDLGTVWADNGNWNIAPVTGDDLVFSGSVGLANNNNLSTAIGGAFLVNSLTFDASAGESFEISGNPVLFNGKTITNNSPYRQSLNLRLQETGTGITATGDKDLYLAGLETNSFNHLFTKNGAGLVEVDGTYSTVDGTGGAPFQLAVNSGILDWAGGIFGTTNVGTATAGATLLASNANWHYNTTLKLNNAASVIGFTATLTEIGQLDAVSGSVIKSLAGGGVTTIYISQPRASTIAGNLQDSPDGGRLALLLGMTGTPTVTLSGTNTSTGDIEVGRSATGAALNLTATGSLTFKIEPDGVSNKISGQGAVSLNGAFKIGLTAAGRPAVGAKWTLVQATNVTYGSTFSVADFMEISPGIWKKVVGSDTWYFTKVSGKLGYGILPDSIWAGGSGGGGWSTGGNWTSLSAPLTGDVPVFTGTSTTNNNDLGTAWDASLPGPGTVQLAGLRFDAAAGSFNLTGNEVYLDGKTIQNLSANPQTISAGIGAGAAGFTVSTSAGDISLTGALNNYDATNASNRALTKTGTGKLILNGTQNQGWALNVNAGTLQVFNPITAGKQVGSGGTVAAGATLRTETTDAFTNNALMTIHGTLDIAGDGESFGGVAGAGLVTNHGAGGGTTLLSFQRNTNIWGGVIQNGGNVTAVAFNGTTAADTVTFTGQNRYTGNTTVGATATFTLANGASLAFAPGANSASNKITGAGTVNLNGKLKLDLSNADPTNGNAWSLVDADTLAETYGSSFAVSDSAWISPTATKVNSSANAIGDFAPGATFVSGGAIYTGGTGPINLTGVTDPAPEAVYIAERYGNMTYTFGGLTIGNNYKVRLHFAEVYWNAAAKRVFNVSINGVLTLDHYDIWVAAGNAQKKAVIEERTVAANDSGAITINFANVTDNGKVCGIEIIDTRPGSATPDFAKSGDVWTRTDGTKTWTFSQTTGVLSLANSSSGGTGYASWISGSGLPIADQDPGDDPDHDGLSNLVEYALDGLNPAASDKTPGTMTGNTLSFTKRPIATDVTYSLVSSTDLGATDDWTPVTPDLNNTTTISYTFPHTVPRDFVRLKILK